jgi:pilus assembly protein CpaB
MAISAPARQNPSQSKPAARRSLFLVGIAMAVVAALLVIILGSVVAGRATAATVQVSVVVAAQDISHRHVVRAGDLALATIPVSAVAPGTLLQQSQALGKVAQVDILKGQPISANLVVSEGSGDPALLPIPVAWVASAIPVNEQQGVGGYVSPGDVVDLIATWTDAIFNPVAVPTKRTKTILSGLHVIRVGSATATSKAGQPQGVVSSLTVLVTRCDPPYLEWLLDNSVTFQYALLSSADYGKAPTAADPACPAGTTVTRVGPTEVDRKFGMTKA